MNKSPAKTSPRSTAAKSEPAPSAHTARNIRETVESIVIAFILAFLFRTFEAEAFVIPTGSMAPTLQGRHKDVECSQCGFRFQASASQEEDPQLTRDQQVQAATVAATCPICRWTMQVAPVYEDGPAPADLEEQSSYNGDRILVSKFAYQFGQPKRWDVIVFKYPGEGKQNYIKRLIGLPGETIRIFQGDIFVKNRQGERGERGLDEFTIERKTPDKVRAVMQVVHDTDYDPLALREAGWPLRWNDVPGGQADSGWKVEETPVGKTVRQTYSTDGSSTEARLRYQHLVPELGDWLDVQEAQTKTMPPLPRLITDFYPYNTEVKRSDAKQQGFAEEPVQLAPEDHDMGLHWVGDLVLECDVEIVETAGELVLDLVEAGKRFSCSIDLKSGQATVAIEGTGVAPRQAQTPIKGPGRYQLRFANVDDQLVLWVDDLIIALGDAYGTVEYDATKVFGDRRFILPRTSEDDAGDLSPVGITSRRAKLKLHRLRVLRDIYYIGDRADSQTRAAMPNVITEYDRRRLEQRLRNQQGYISLVTDAATWDLLETRKDPEFTLRKDPANPDADQFFVLGDNSPSSMDSRLWARKHLDRNYRNRIAKQPGGPYVERRLLTGKALFVYWPHSWGFPVPFFPNFRDMRLIR